MFEAYEVAVKLKLVDQFSGVMGMVVNRLTSANHSATELQKKLDGIARTFKTGLLVTGAGFGMAMALKAATNEAVKYEQQLNRLKALNLGSANTNHLADRAAQIARTTKGMSYTESLKLMTEAQSITGNVEHTLDLAPVLAKMRFGMETYMSSGGKGEGHGAQAERQFMDVVKVMELRGLMRNFNEDKLNSLADLFVKNYAASGGQVKPSDFLAMMKTGGIASKGINEDFMFALGHMMQESGGNRSGTALMSTYQNLIAGRTTQQVAEQLQKYGLLNPGSIEYGTTGHIKKIKPEALKQTEMLMANPLDYLNNVILPALASKGVDINNQNQVLMKLNQLTSNRTASNFLGQLYMDRTPLANYVKQAHGAMGVNQLYDQSANSVVGKEIDLRAKLLNLEKTLGDAALPILVKALETLVPLVQEFGAALEKHPTLIKAVMFGFAGLAASMMVAGPLMMLTSGFKAVGLAVSVLNGGGVGGLLTLAGSLTNISSLIMKIGAMGGGLGAAAMVTGAGLGGYAVGTAIYNNMKTEDQDAIGRTIARGLALFGSKDAEEALAAERKSGYVQPKAAPNPLQVTVPVHIDGKKVAQVMSPYLAAQTGRAMSGGALDGNLMVPMPGTN
ncbi:hypothetical protein HNQ50_000316 [Silvimonas terrae]|uniref:Phage tail tape measure protein n=1 Tax=Silvimonas terrae TaxID=300266 RepID=A0A840RAX6_9NEIS|nr:hypothetical protein [Silvimonas terrae]MBB5189606.1 hypothetical protein [Silvimonas terrae]